MKPYFRQCQRDGQWVCEQVCWNHERGLCVTCAPKLDQEIAGLPRKPNGKGNLARLLVEVMHEQH